MITIYHGSNKIIEKPRYGVGKPYNDYGLGFYCTKELGLAREWAVSEQQDGYANQYQLELNGLKVLDLSAKEYNILHWITILLQNRLFDIQSDFGEEAKKYLMESFDIGYENYDVIVGYRADDSYFSFAQDFLNNAISLRQLSRAMYLGDLGKQIVLKSRKAFEQITFEDAIPAEARVWQPKKLMRDSSRRGCPDRRRKDPSDVHPAHGERRHGYGYLCGAEPRRPPHRPHPAGHQGRLHGAAALLRRGMGRDLFHQALRGGAGAGRRRPGSHRRSYPVPQRHEYAVLLSWPADDLPQHPAGTGLQCAGHRFRRGRAHRPQPWRRAGGKDRPWVSGHLPFQPLCLGLGDVLLPVHGLPHPPAGDTDRSLKLIKTRRPVGSSPRAFVFLKKNQRRLEMAF